MFVYCFVYLKSETKNEKPYNNDNHKSSGLKYEFQKLKNGNLTKNNVF